MALILAWADGVKLKGEPRHKYAACAMSQDGRVLVRATVPSTDWAKSRLGVTTEENHPVYAEEYPSGFEVVWLDDPYTDARWWRAHFFGDCAWTLAFYKEPLRYFEFRDYRGTVRGYVVEHHDLPGQWYIVPGHTTPRNGDIFPAPAHDLRAAMNTAHQTFSEAL